MNSEKAFIDKLMPAPKGGGFSMDGYWVWGSSVIKGEDGLYHMFASRWSKQLNFNNWVSNSEIVRATAATPVRPFEFQEVVTPARGPEFRDGLSTHNPRILKYRDTYLLYYFGLTYDFPVPTDKENIWADTRAEQAWMNKRIFLATAPSITGPWTRTGVPVIEPRPGHWDASITTNPSPAIDPETGRVLLMYKSSTHGLTPPLLLGVSKADHFSGPYTRPVDEPCFQFDTSETNKNDVEDPFIWWNGSGYEVIMKDRFGHISGESGGGLHGYSADGINWKLSDSPKAFSKTIRWDDGTVTQQNHFERPFLLIEDGRPTHLYAATGVGPAEWKFDRTWNMVIPLKS